MTPFTPLDLPPLGERPLISVLMSSYNYARYIADAIASVVAQTWDHWELVICDDGSTDASPAIIAEWAAREPRVRLLQVANGGQAAAWNHAYAACRGELVCFLDPDDRALPDKLARIAAAFQADNRVGAVTHRLRVVSADGVATGANNPARLDCGWLAPLVLRQGGIASWPPTSGIALRRELCERLFPTPVQLRLGFADAYLMCGAAVLADVACIAAPLSEYRVHGENQSAMRRPAEDTFARNVRYHALLFDAVSELYARLAPDGEPRIQFADIPNLFWLMLGHYLVSGKDPAALRGVPRAEALRHIEGRRRRLCWRALVALPAPLARRVFNSWWNPGATQRALRRLWSPQRPLVEMCHPRDSRALDAGAASVVNRPAG